MAFRGVLPEAPSFGTQFARSLGGGISQGISSASDMASKFALKKYETNLRQKMIEQIEGRKPIQNDQQTDQHFLDELPKMEQKLGRELSTQEVDQIYPQWQKLRGGLQQEQQSQNQSEDPYLKAKQYAAGDEHDLARVAIEEAKFGEKRKMVQEERDYLPKKEYQQHAAKENIDFLGSVKKIEGDVPQTDFAIAMIEDSLGDAGKWAAAKDWLAENTNYPGFASASGVELNSAVKNYFLGDLNAIKGGKANVFLEKQIRDAYPKAGQDPIANQKIFLGMRLKKDIDKLKVEKTRELESMYLDKQGYLPPGFESMVNRSIRNDVESVEKKAINTLHHMSKIEGERDKIFRAYLNPGEVLMMDAEGNPYAVKKKEVPMYREQGYIPMGEK